MTMAYCVRWKKFQGNFRLGNDSSVLFMILKKSYINTCSKLILYKLYKLILWNPIIKYISKYMLYPENKVNALIM